MWVVVRENTIGYHLVAISDGEESAYELKRQAIERLEKQIDQNAKYWIDSGKSQKWADNYKKSELRKFQEGLQVRKIEVNELWEPWKK